MYKVTLLSTLLLLSVVSAFCQDIDSLYVHYQKAGNHERVDAANELLKSLEEQRYAVGVLEITGETIKSEMEIEVMTWMANYTFLKERYLETIEFMSKVIDLSKAERDSASLERAYYLSGFAYQRLGDVDKALNYSTESYELCKALNNEERLSSVINNIANIYQTNNQDSTAILFYKETIDIERRLGRNQQLATRLGNLSTSYMKQERLDEALAVVTEALALDRAGTRPDKTAARLTQLADVYMAMGKYPETKQCLNEANAYFEESGSLYGMAIALNMLGEVEQLSGSPARSSAYFEKAAYCAAKNENKYVYQKIARNIYMINKERDPAKALKYYEESVAIKDSIFGIETQRQIGEFQVKYETAEKELEILNQQTEINKHRTKQYIYIGGLVVAGMLLILLLYIARLRTKRNRALAETNATKDKFFSIISHDLKNPAIAQRDALQQLITYSGEWDADSLSQYYEELLKSADGQVELLYNLLNWAQVQTGRMPYNPTPFDLVAELHSDIALIRNMADRKGITLDIRMPDTAIVTGDRNMLTTVVRNLLTNAVKFTDKGGCITLEIQPEDNDSYTVSVTDTGRGMTREQIDNLFRIDRQRSRTGTAGESGSGLGLVVCNELIEKHGSVIHAESEEKQGSRFWFTI